MAQILSLYLQNLFSKMMEKEYLTVAFAEAGHVRQGKLPGKHVAGSVPLSDHWFAVGDAFAGYPIAFGFVQVACVKTLVAGLLAAAVTRDYGYLKLEDIGQAVETALIAV